MQELLTQMNQIGEISNKSLTKSSSNILEIDKDINKFVNSDKISKKILVIRSQVMYFLTMDSQLKMVKVGKSGKINLKQTRFWAQLMIQFLWMEFVSVLDL